MSVAPPLPARTGVEGETAFAAESPELDTASVAVNAWPTFTDCAETLSAPARAAGAWTTTLAGAGVAAATVCPLLASVPDALPEKLAVPSPAPRYVQVNACAAPPAMVALAGAGPETSVAPAPPTVSAGVTFVAEAPPGFFTVSETVIAWPLFAVEGVAAIPDKRAAGAWTRTGPAFAEVDTFALLSLSVPLALIAKSSDPAPVVWNVHGLIPVATFLEMSTWPALVTSTRSTRSCPTLTCVRSRVVLAWRKAALEIVTAFEVAEGSGTGEPLFWSVPEPETLNCTGPATSIA